MLRGLTPVIVTVSEKPQTGVENFAFLKEPLQLQWPDCLKITTYMQRYFKSLNISIEFLPSFTQEGFHCWAVMAPSPNLHKLLYVADGMRSVPLESVCEQNKKTYFADMIARCGLQI